MTPLFESSVNSEDSKTTMIILSYQEMFESSVNSEDSKTKLDQDVDAFLSKITKNEGFLLAFMDAVNEKYYKTAIILG